MLKAAAEVGAHFVSFTSVSWVRAPSAVGGFVLDATIQYTLMRPYDAAIVAERQFTGRGSGISEEMALQRVLNDVAPTVARDLAGRLAEAIFAGGSVVDPDVAPRNAFVNVFSRPDASSTSALVSLLRAEGLTVSLGAARVTIDGAMIGQPADQLIIEGPVEVERLFDVFAQAKFGPKGVLRASVTEYGDNYVGLSIVDRTPPVPIRPKRIEASLSVGAAVPRPVPVAPTAAPAGTVVGARVSGGVAVAAPAKPLEFRLRAEFTKTARVQQ
jgi:hypothetical protein